MTLLVQTLEQRGWVKRERPADDGRVVLVSLTKAGKETLEEFRAQLGAALRARLDTMPDEQIATLKTATEALGSLVHVLQPGRDVRPLELPQVDSSG
jgi:DNA-binding MarR family transcriptional regulator